MQAPRPFPAPVLAFGFRARVGKDHAGTVIRQSFPGSRRLAFADALKHDLVALLCEPGLNPFSADSREKEIIRPLLVGYGMTMRRYDPDYWIKQVFQEIDASPQVQPPLWVITDVRFANEVRAIQARGGIVVGVEPIPDLPWANVEEAEHAPGCYAIADAIIRNDFSPGFDRQVRLLAAASLLKNDPMKTGHTPAVSLDEFLANNDEVNLLLPGSEPSGRRHQRRVSVTGDGRLRAEGIEVSRAELEAGRWIGERSLEISGGRTVLFGRTVRGPE